MCDVGSNAGRLLLPPLLKVPHSMLARAVASTDLEEQLRRRGIRRLLVIGVATNVCVTNAVFQAVVRRTGARMISGAACGGL